MSAVADAITGLTIAGKKLSADVSEIVLDVTRTIIAGQVSELTIVLHDPDLAVFNGPIGTADAPVVFDGGTYGVAGREVDRAAGAVTVHASSVLARALRKKVKVSAEKKVSAVDWTRGRVRAHGGKLVTVSPASKKSVISQGKGQSELDIIAGFGGDLDWLWAEWDGTVYLGTGMDWYTKGPGKTWSVTWQTESPTDAFDVKGGMTPDDKDNAGEITVSYPYEGGKKIRPFDRLRLSGHGILDGDWLTTDTTTKFDGSSPVDVKAIIPRKARPKKNSRKG